MELSARFADADSFVLGCFDAADALCGLLAAFRDGDYLQTTAFNAVCAECYADFTEYLRLNYAHAEINVGVSAENKDACDALGHAGFALIEASHDMRLERSAFPSHSLNRSPGILRVRSGDLAEYARFHDAHFPDVYWNARRLGERLDDWLIFAAKERGAVRAGMYLTVYGENGENAEIYGLAAEPSHEWLLDELLARGLDDLFAEKLGVRKVVFMIDEADGARLAPAERLGFTRRGMSRLYSLPRGRQGD